MRLNICVNKKAPFGPFAAFIKGCITFHSGGRNRGQPTQEEEMANPQGTKVFAVERHDLSRHPRQRQGLRVLYRYDLTYYLSLLA